MSVMFGLVAQVSLYDYDTKDSPYVFRFDANEQHGEKSNNTRIVFHTNHYGMKDSYRTAQVELYNLNQKYWDWISAHGGNWQNGFQSNMFLKLEVGWSGFGDYSPLYTLYDGNVNSFWVEREGRDNVFNFACGMLPAKDNQSPISAITSVPQSTSVTRFGGTRGEMLKQLFADFLYSTNYAFTKLGIKPTKDGYAAWQSMIKNNQVAIKISFPLYDNLGDETESQDPSGRAWLTSQISKPMSKTFDCTRDLKNFLSAEGAMMLDYYTVMNGTQPVFVLKIQKANIRQLRYGTRVPNANVIVNHEMLTKDPSVTPTGVQLESLMRPWIDVGDVIKLEILTSEKDLATGQIKNPEYIRPRSAYALNLSGGASDKVMNVWGQDTRVLDMNNRLAQDKKTSSIYNVPLQVVRVQHLGDTHGKNWHSLIQTYQPKITMG